jgi:GNAT superfamily N-acetyltransferase
MTEVTIVSGYVPGLIGGIVSLHAGYYARHWGFGCAFEALVARDLAELLARNERSRDGVWSAWHAEQLVGAAAIDGRVDPDGSARLRFFVVDEALQGGGIGRQLLRAALDHADALEAPLVWLTTFAGLERARRLYEQHGFVLVHQSDDTTWGVTVSEQRFERRRFDAG